MGPASSGQGKEVVKKNKRKCAECDKTFRALYTVRANILNYIKSGSSMYLCKKCRRRFLKESPTW